MTQITIELPEQLAEQLNAYLVENPEDSMIKIIKQALRTRQVPKDRSDFLALAGVVKEAPRDASENAEDFLG